MMINGKALDRLGLWFQWGASFLACVGVAYLSALQLNAPIPYISISALHKIILIAVEFFLWIYLIRTYLQHAWGEVKLSTYLLIFLFANCFITFPFLSFYLDRARQAIPVIAAIQPYLVPGYLALLVMTGILAILSHQDIRRLRLWLLMSLDVQRQEELDRESNRQGAFVRIFPRLARIPLAGSLARKVYAEGPGALLLLVFLLGIGLLLRVWNLGSLPPYADELYHLLAAEDIVQGQALGQIAYQRSFYTVTIPVAWSLSVFGVDLWAARLPGMLINLLAAIPLYWIGKRVNKTVALLCVGLYVTNPWLIAIARTVREYAYYPFYFYVAAWIVLKLYDLIPAGTVLVRDLRRLLSLRMLIYAGMLAFLVIYVALIDSKATIKVILGIYLSLAILILLKINWREISNLVLILSAFIGGALLSFTVLPETTHELFTGKLNGYFLTLFSPAAPQQWYYNRSVVIVLVLLAAFFLIRWRGDKKKEEFFFLLTFVIFHLSFAALWVKGEKPRYAITIELWYVPLVALGLYALYTIGVKKIKQKTLVWLILLLTFWNAGQSLVPASHTAPGYAPITGEFHADFAPAVSFLRERVNADEVVFCSSYFANYLDWVGGLKTDNIQTYDYTQPEVKPLVRSTIETHDRGWIVLYSRRDDLRMQPLQPHDFTYADKEVEFIGWFGDQYLFRWRK